MWPLTIGVLTADAMFNRMDDSLRDPHPLGTCHPWRTVPSLAPSLALRENLSAHVGGCVDISAWSSDESRIIMEYNDK